ncbi:hypothetical protein SAMN05216532_3372 [Streptomyces sp. 2231.1]|uniref:hypothetical protein n=1 Tax=Streptomyces sp. 2231.1 TaxID=1855347 RepID=UPI00089A8851|nr:hypothetical protein [Streptomyces sp. 2231.1]SED08295.1 hypothetical protein SAMN05216532_3372 [Streptomyces sp. 2231.1]
MYAVVRRYEGVTDPAEAGRRVNDGVMISTSVFDDEAGAGESVRRAAVFVRDHLASLLPKPPQVMSGQVVASL